MSKHNKQKQPLTLIKFNFKKIMQLKINTPQIK